MAAAAKASAEFVDKTIAAVEAGIDGIDDVGKVISPASSALKANKPVRTPKKVPLIKIKLTVGHELHPTAKPSAQLSPEARRNALAGKTDARYSEFYLDKMSGLLGLGRGTNATYVMLSFEIRF